MHLVFLNGTAKASHATFRSDQEKNGITVKVEARAKAKSAVFYIVRGKINREEVSGRTLSILSD
jgi:hypothetical protein